ncbi:MAG: hypothetical protein K2M08_00615 [Anaeroplasmataceae bacterium]|nr:hypothetical protein [Anaeroplasmataceae bacterium]
MEILMTTTDIYFNEKSRLLGNCYLVIEDGIIYHYEFLVTKNKAEIICDSSTFLEYAVEHYHKEHPYINEYYIKDKTFFMTFDKIHTFKLPISILQVSSIFLDATLLEKLKNYEDIEDVFFPVQIVDDEYVVLDKLHQLYLASENGSKMVDVYMDEDFRLSRDYLYLAKEQNIKTIKDTHIISHDEYEAIYSQLKGLLDLI